MIHRALALGAVSALVAACAVDATPAREGDPHPGGTGPDLLLRSPVPGEPAGQGVMTPDILGGSISNRCSGDPTVPTVRSLSAFEDGSMRYDLCLPVSGNGQFMFLYGRFGDPTTQQVIQSGSGSSNLYETGVPTGAMYFFEAQAYVSGFPSGHYQGWNSPSFVYNPYFGTHWADVSQVSNATAGAWNAGVETWLDRSQHPRFVCAAMIENGTHIGNVSVDDPQNCHVSWGGVDHVTTQFMVLQGATEVLGWQTWSTPAVPRNAIAAGWENGHSQFICQAPVWNPVVGATDLIPGKTVGAACNVAFAGQEVPVPNTTAGVQIMTTITGGEGDVCMLNLTCLQPLNLVCTPEPGWVGHLCEEGGKLGEPCLAGGVCPGSSLYCDDNDTCQGDGPQCGVTGNQCCTTYPPCVSPGAECAAGYCFVPPPPPPSSGD